MMFSSVEILKRELACINRRDSGHCNRVCFECDLLLWGVDLREAFNDAIEALENESKAEEYRTPQKIENKSSLRCPKCNYELAGAKQSIIYMAPFCPNCGQALDWPEEERQALVMRPSTKDERDNIDKYIDSISTKTGANFSDK